MPSIKKDYNYWENLKNIFPPRMCTVEWVAVGNWNSFRKKLPEMICCLQLNNGVDSERVYGARSNIQKYLGWQAADTAILGCMIIPGSSPWDLKEAMEILHDNQRIRWAFGIFWVLLLYQKQVSRGELVWSVVNLNDFQCQCWAAVAKFHFMVSELPVLCYHKKSWRHNVRLLGWFSKMWN